MATWAQVKSEVTSSSAFASASVDKNLVKVEVPTNNGRTQIVYLGDGGDKLTIMSAVCALDEVNLDGLFGLEVFQQMPYGVSSTGDYLVLKHSTLLETLDIQEIATPMVELAFLADTLEHAITGRDDH
jgi:hypothetical protein